jgi:hypothetical protein
MWAGWDFGRGSDVVVAASGGLAHIFFNVTAERMAISSAVTDARPLCPYVMAR